MTATNNKQIIIIAFMLFLCISHMFANPSDFFKRNRVVPKAYTNAQIKSDSKTVTSKSKTNIKDFHTSKFASSIKILSDDDDFSSCVELVPESNGDNAAITISVTNEWWSSFTFKITIRNLCSNITSYKGLKIGIKGTKLNNSSSKKFYDSWISQPDQKWIDTSEITYDEDEDTNYIVVTGHWFEITVGYTHSFTFNAGYNGALTSLTYESIVIGENEVKSGSLIVNISNIPTSMGLSPSVILYNSSDAQIASSVLSTTSETSTITFSEVSTGTGYYVFVQGMLDPFTHVSTSPFVIEDITISKGEDTTVNGTYQSSELTGTILSYSGYDSDKGIVINLSSDSADYVFTSSYEDEGTSSTTITIPTDITFTLSLDANDKNYSVALSGTEISPLINSISVIFTYASKEIGGYFASWWDTNNPLLNEIPSYVSNVLIAFAKPNLTYTSGSFTNTGLEFSTSFSETKNRIATSKAANSTGIQRYFS